MKLPRPHILASGRGRGRAGVVAECRVAGGLAIATCEHGGDVSRWFSGRCSRILAPRLSGLLGQQVIVENVGGAGGMIGVSRVAKAAPDGYQFVLGNLGTFAATQTLHSRPLYNSTTDFEPVALIVEQSAILIARKDLPVHNLQEFIAYAKANHAGIQYGSAGIGSFSQLVCELLHSSIGVSVTHVPFRGAVLAMQEVIAGRIDYLCPVTAIALPNIESNQVKPIAMLSKSRPQILPKLATAHEQGLVDFDAYFWDGIFLPRSSTPLRSRR
jgi:tripartite-type tricarboxylate transporter receptor subunit TctC